MTEWAVLVFSLRNEKDTGAGKGRSTNKRGVRAMGGVGDFNKQNKTANLKEDTVNTGPLNSLLELPETQS